MYVVIELLWSVVVIYGGGVGCKLFGETKDKSAASIGNVNPLITASVYVSMAPNII